MIELLLLLISRSVLFSRNSASTKVRENKNLAKNPEFTVVLKTIQFEVKISLAQR